MDACIHTVCTCIPHSLSSPFSRDVDSREKANSHSLSLSLLWKLRCRCQGLSRASKQARTAGTPVEEEEVAEVDASLSPSLSLSSTVVVGVLHLFSLSSAGEHGFPPLHPTCASPVSLASCSPAAAAARLPVFTWIQQLLTLTSVHHPFPSLTSPLASSLAQTPAATGVRVCKDVVRKDASTTTMATRSLPPCLQLTLDR